MALIHFLNVKDGDCTIIQHDSGRTTVIDVCSARRPNLFEFLTSEVVPPTDGSFHQKRYPVNPLEYMRRWGYTSVFRFILTHPDMDHMDGIEALFHQFQPTNFWDTDNRKAIQCFKGSPYKKEDWDFYQQVRERKDDPTAPNVLQLYEGAHNQFYNQPDGGDGLYILAPFQDLMKEARKTDDYNDASYVLMLLNSKRKVIFGGDSHDKTWEKILDRNSCYRKYIKDIDVLIAPHHGRKSERNYSFLDVLRPKLTLFGNAPSNQLAYSSYKYRKLPYITNNQAGSVILDVQANGIYVYVTNQSYANTFLFSKYSARHDAYFIRVLR